jgi:hypothetical protein
MRRTILLVVACTLALTLCAAAVEPADVLKVDYFANANTAGAPDGTLRITNPGTSGGNLCAAIYVYDSFQELSECCSCKTTPNDLRTLSVNTDLTGNPLTGVTLSTGSIRIVSTPTSGGSCPLPTKLTPTAAVRSWTTHIQNGSFSETETASQDATLSTSEQTALQNACFAVQLVGSSKGVCTCGTGE